MARATGKTGGSLPVLLGVCCVVDDTLARASWSPRPRPPHSPSERNDTTRTAAPSPGSAWLRRATKASKVPWPVRAASKAESAKNESRLYRRLLGTSPLRLDSSLG